jgi:hypothetical protein
VARWACRDSAERVALECGSRWSAIARGALSRFGRCASAARGLQRYARAARFAQANRNGLLRRTGAVLAFADVLDLFMYELPSRGAGRFAFAQVFLGFLDSRFFGHLRLLWCFLGSPGQLL